METPTKLKRAELPAVKRELIARQNGCCLFCGGDITQISSVNQVVDHNHTTGIIRGVAHKGCNGVEGKVLRQLKGFGKCRTQKDVVRMAKRLAVFWEKEPTTLYIYPTHKTPAEKREAANKKARLAYAKKKRKT